MQAATASRSMRRRSVAHLGHRIAPLSLVCRVWSTLKRLTAESGLWANAGNQFSDLADAQAWMAQSPRMHRRRSVAVGTIRLPPPPTTKTTLLDRTTAYADHAVAWAVDPVFRCCVEIEKLQEIRLGAVFSRVVVQFMLQIFIVLSEAPSKWRARHSKLVE